VVRPRPEEVPVSFPSEPGRDDGNLPPVNVEIPDDARELDRDVLAYRRELRARRRRDRLVRIFRPLGGTGFGAGAAVIPLIAACLALSLIGGALLSVMTISPAKAPTVTTPRTSAPAAQPGSTLTELPVALPAGTVRVGPRTVAVKSLVSSVIAVVPGNCDCGQELEHLAALTDTVGVPLYFAGTGTVVGQLPAFSVRYSKGKAIVADDTSGVLESAFRPVGLLVLVVRDNATAIVLRTLPPDTTLVPALDQLRTVGV
jgi:hypothetical protein